MVYLTDKFAASTPNALAKLVQEHPAIKNKKEVQQKNSEQAGLTVAEIRCPAKREIGGKTMDQNFTKLAFTDSVKNAQEHYGSRISYSRTEKSGDRYVLTKIETQFIESRDSFFMATRGENGWPYIQFRGGPKGFLKIIDDTTLSMADFRGKSTIHQCRQY